MMPVVCSVEKDGIYRSGDLLLLPKPVERVLVQLYYRFEADRLLELIFHEAAQKPTLQWFLAEYLKPETSTLTCYRETDKPVDETYSFRVEEKFYTPLGMIWINRSWDIGANFKKSECGMSFVRGTPLDDTVKLGQMAITWAFDNLAIDSLIGCTPSPNRAAVLFGQKLGFQQTSPLDGYSCWRGKMCSVVLQSMTKEKWQTVWKTEPAEKAA